MLYTVPLKTYMYDYTASIHSFCSPHVLSSSPPWQSSAPSHLLTRGMHWRDERHSNWLPAQLEPGGGAATGKEYWSYESTYSWIQQCSTVFQSEINRCLEDNRGINKNCRNVILPPLNISGMLNMKISLKHLPSVKYMYWMLQLTLRTMSTWGGGAGSGFKTCDQVYPIRLKIV